MNKNIKRIIALTLIISAYGAISPTISEGYFNIGTKPVYAASYSPSSKELTTLSVKSTEGDTLDLLDDYNGDEVKLSEDKQYYVKVTDDGEGVKINATAKNTDYVVKIFTSDNKDAVEFKPGDKIQLAKGNTTLYVRTYKSASEYRKAKETKKDVTICEQEYKIFVKKTVASSSEDSTQDPIYIDKLQLNKGTISFFKQTTSYDITVDKSVEEIKITATPEDANYRVRIDGSLVEKTDGYRKTVGLNLGENEIKVKVTDSKDNQRTYTLNIKRGTATNNQDNIYLENITTSEGTLEFLRDTTTYKIDLDQSIDTVKIGAPPEDDEYLVTINGDQVKPGDEYEKKISLEKGANTVNVVIKDEVNNKTKTYTLAINRGSAKDTQNTATTTTKKSAWVETSKGWQYNDENGKVLKNSWLFDKEASVYCYLDENGFRKTGWFKDKEIWYLLNDKGVMLTGWQDKDGIKYFFESNGAMFKGWHKEEVTNTDNTKTENWYYLNSNGSMKTGWLSDGEKWYFLNETGIMQKGWLISNNSKYYLNGDGTMVTGTKTIDGKTYKFTNLGVLII
jgi:glucan-binding YG repeat protein